MSLEQYLDDPENEITSVFDLPFPPVDLPEAIPHGTETGRVRNLLALEEEDFQIKPLARRLAKICRYGGASPWFYAVTSHSLLVSKLLENEQGPYAKPGARAAFRADDVRDLAYAGLMHDVTEAFGIGDMISPLKRLKGFEAYNEIEYRIREQLVGPFDLIEHELPEVKRADERAYQLECRYMKGSWPKPNHTKFEPWYPTDAEHEACLFYLKQEISWRDSARLFIAAFDRLAPAAVKERCL